MYGLVERLESYSAPTGEPAVVAELGWKLTRPFVYVVRVPPSGNCKNTTMRFHPIDRDTHKHFGNI
jgi:hypothetical protein